MKFYLIALLSFTAVAKTLVITQNKNLSEVLIAEGLINSNLELHKVKRVLDENNLDWKTARTLPEGYEFTADSLKEFKQKILLESRGTVKAKTIKNNMHWLIDIRALNQELKATTSNNNNRTLFSAFSQEIEAALSFDFNSKYSLINSFTLTNAQYYEDNDQNIDKSSNRLTHSFRSGVRYENTPSLSIEIGLDHFSQNYFTIGSNNKTDFERTNETGYFAKLEGYLFGKRNLKAGSSVTSNLTSDDLENYFRYNLYLIQKINWNQKRFNLSLTYSESEFSINNENYAQRDLAIGLRKRF